MLIVPLTFGSTMKLRPVISETALTTASMSALTKFKVTVSSAAKRGCVATDGERASSDRKRKQRRPRRTSRAAEMRDR